MSFISFPVTFFEAADGDITAHLDGALSTNARKKGHSLQANCPALLLAGDLKVTFPVKVRVAWASNCLHGEAPFFFLSYIPILRHPTKPQLNKEEHFYFPQQPASKKAFLYIYKYIEIYIYI